MSTTGLKKGVGFLIIPEPVLNDVGPIGALVFGSVFRHNLMSNGMCYASQKTLAEMSKVSLRSTNHWLGELVKSDYLRIAKNPIANFTNVYFVTEKSGANVVDADQVESSSYELNKVLESINNKKVDDPNYMNYGDS